MRQQDGFPGCRSCEAGWLPRDGVTDRFRPASVLVPCPRCRQDDHQRVMAAQLAAERIGPTPESRWAPTDEGRAAIAEIRLLHQGVEAPPAPYEPVWDQEPVYEEPAEEGGAEVPT